LCCHGRAGQLSFLFGEGERTVPNGHDANWVRVCAAIDGFRGRYGRWLARVRLFSVALEAIHNHILTPEGFAVVASVVELVADDAAPMIAEGAEGESYNYGREGFPNPKPDEPTREWFGQAVLQPDLRE
jgi:hypothetical protein